MKKLSHSFVKSFSFSLFMGSSFFSYGQQKPNIVLIYADDIGYGDLSIYGGKISTPNIDSLAKKGVVHHNAYATAATCTPSRYSLLSGEYAWRKKGTGVTNGDANALLKSGRQTVASVLKKSGYKTAVIGKWHLGLGKENSGSAWNGNIIPGPLEVGFDYSYLIPATADRVPCVYLENHHVDKLAPNDSIYVNYSKRIGNWATGREKPELLKLKYSHGHDQTIINGISRIGYQFGGSSALWRDEDIADTLISKSQAFIKANQNQAFFLYLATSDIHVPRMPNERFQGKTTQGLRGDAILSFDYTVGAITRFIDSLNLRENTIIIVTSDNGPVLDDGYADSADKLTGKHNPFGGLRGGKYSTFEAGTRIPFILSWKGVVQSSHSNALISQVDLLKNLATLNNVKVDSLQAPDSQYQWNAWIGKDTKGRNELVQEAIQKALSIVSGHYKYIPPHKGGKKPSWGVDIETGFDTIPQLYNLEKDPMEKDNIASKNPQIVIKMAKKLEAIKTKTLPKEQLKL